MHHATFAAPDLTTFYRLDELGLEAVDQLLEPDRAVLECRVVDDEPWCREYGSEGVPRDAVTRPLAHERFGHRPTTLLVRVRRYRCGHCRQTWRQDMSKAAESRAKISRGGIWWALTAIGVYEHVWRHTRHGDKCVTVMNDLTPARNKTGPARLLDMVKGRSKAVFKLWLAGRPKELSKQIEVVAMDRFSGFETAAAEELPDAVPGMDPFHVVRLAGDALDVCRRRVQHDPLGRRGIECYPRYQARRTLHTGDKLLTDKQRSMLQMLFTADNHVEVEATWGIYQRIIAAYREPD